MDLKVDETYTFKLNSGEELVAKLVEQENNGFIVITNPVSVGPGPGGGLGLVPSLFTSNPRENVRLNTNSIALIATIDENVRSKYIEATTGLKVPDKKVILG